MGVNIKYKKRKKEKNERVANSMVEYSAFNR